MKLSTIKLHLLQGRSGIGLGIAKAFLNSGANVAIGDINKEQLSIAEKELKTISGSSR